MTPIEKAVAVCGSQAELARRIGVTTVFAHQMVRGIKKIPPGLCRKIEHATDGQVTAEALRPDVFGYSVCLEIKGNDAD